MADCVIICDQGNNRIVKVLADDLSFITESSGFSQPSGLANDGTSLYVADTLIHRIVKCNPLDLSIIGEVGSSGSGNDEFANPAGVACDGIHIYVADSDNYRIVKRLASDLSYVSQIGSFGFGNDQFNGLYGIACDNTYLYLVDAGNNRIMKRLASDLSYVSEIGSGGSGNDQFNSPYGIAADETYVYVADAGNSRVVKRFSSDLSYDSQIGSFGPGIDEFNGPQGISEFLGTLYVGDTGNNRVVKRLSSDLSYISEGNIGGNLFTPIGTTAFFVSPPVTNGRSIYIADTNNNRIIERTVPDLLFIGNMTSALVPDVIVLDNLEAIAVSSTHLFIENANKLYSVPLADVSELAQMNATVGGIYGNLFGLGADDVNVYVPSGENQVLAYFSLPDLVFTGAIGFYDPGSFNTPENVCSDGTYMYVTDYDDHKVVKLRISDQVFQAEIGSLGTGDDNFNQPEGICTDGTHVYVCDAGNSRVVKRLASDLSYVGQVGSFGLGDDNFIYPYGIATNGTHIFVCDSVNERIVKRLCSDLSYVSEVGEPYLDTTLTSSPVMETGSGYIINVVGSINVLDTIIFAPSGATAVCQYNDGSFIMFDTITGVPVITDSLSAPGGGGGTADFDTNSYITLIYSFTYAGGIFFNTDNDVIFGSGVSATINLNDSPTGLQVSTNFFSTTVGSLPTNGETIREAIVGSGSTGFSNPIHIGLAGSFIYILDRGNNRIVKRDTTDSMVYDSEIVSINGLVDTEMVQPTGICTDGIFVYIAMNDGIAV